MEILIKFETRLRLAIVNCKTKNITNKIQQCLKSKKTVLTEDVMTYYCTYTWNDVEQV